jgi:hypothetical protein
MIGVIPNPKKSLTVQFPFDDVKEGVKYIGDIHSKYVLTSKNDVLNIYTFSALETLSLGVYIDIAIVKLSDNTTQVDIEVRRKMGAFDQGYEVTKANTHLQNVVNILSSFLGMSDEQKKPLRNKYKADKGFITQEPNTTEFSCPCGKKFFADNSKKRIATCPHCDKKLSLPIPSPLKTGGCMVIIAGALGILSTTLAVVLFTIYH